VSLSLRILAVLPQTQCTRCGYPDCEAYADAIERQEAGINQCPPGGEEGIQRLSALTGLPALPLNPANGSEGPRHIAWIDEQWCIGCTLCISACPTDAILGASKQMHTVIEDACTGCELCLPVCPVDCIHLENVTLGKSGWNAWTQALADQAKNRYELKKLRLAKEQGEIPQSESTNELKQSAVQAALARAKALK
jgi:Na+-translocating ferredoxin:NAD+ oxidoreductase subunit B